METVSSMPEKMSDLQISLEELKKTLSDLIEFFDQGLDYNWLVYELWNAKQIHGHITFWHESFARNISDLGQGRIPNPLSGKLSDVNRQSVESTNAVSIPELIVRLRKSQNTIEQYIYDESIVLIPYKKGSRPYSRIEHLQVVTSHIQKHLKDIKLQYGKSKKQTGITRL